MTVHRVVTFAAAAALSAGALSACADTGGDSSGPSGASGGSGGGKVAFLMPDIASTRYEQFDAPLFTAKMEELCADCEVLYQNADADAAKQQQQADSVLAQGAEVIVLDPVDSAAAASIVRSAQAQDVAVIAYDRPIPDVPADYYVSFDNEKIGASIAQSLVDHLKSTGATGGLLQVNGSPTDAAAGLIAKGASSAVAASGLELLAEFDTPGWQPPLAQEWVSGQVTKFPGQIAGVVAANDGTAGGSIAAFKASGQDLPPVTGNDAELAALQRIIAGDQFNTISKPISTVAEAAAELANAFLEGETPEGETTLFDTPSQLFEPTVVTRENIAEVMSEEGFAVPASEVCVAEYAAACTELGIS